MVAGSGGKEAGAADTVSVATAFWVCDSFEASRAEADDEVTPKSKSCEPGPETGI